MNFKVNFKKIVSVIATSALLFNSVAPYSLAIAQEFTPEPTPVDTSTPAPEVTISPTDSGTPTVTPDATPAETASPLPEVTPAATDLVTPAPTDAPVVTQAPESNPTVQGPPASDQPSSSPTATPVFTSVQPEKEGNLSTTVVENIDLSTVVGLNTNIDTATVTTDKPDYSPTSVVLITGTGFTADKTYSIEISSTDQPPVTHTDNVTADAQGNFSYAYQLDGNYRPNYKIEVKDANFVVARTTFTDSITAFADGTTATGTCTNPGNSVNANNSRSTCTNGQNVVVSNFGLDGIIPTTPTGIGFVVQAEAFTSDSNGNDSFTVDLSWDGGTTFSSGDQSTDQINNESGTGDQTIQAPSNAVCNSFGRTWTASELTNGNFRVRLVGSGSTLSLDRVQVQVCSDNTVVATVGSGGSISPSGTTSISDGANQTFDITPSANNIVSTVSVDGGASSGRLNTYTFTNVIANHTISASFEGGWSAPSGATNDNSVSSETEAYSSNNAYAVFNGDSDSVDYINFGLSIPSGATINGIEVAIEGNRTSGRTLDVSLSGDGGSNFSSTKNATFTSADSTAILGGASDAWGESWTADNFTNGNFRLKAEAGNESDNLNIDQIQAKVSYTLATPTATPTTTPTATPTAAPAATPAPNLNWPSEWTTPNSCVTDPSGEPGVSPTEVDLVGNTGTPAVGFSSDANYFYFRERVNGDPGLITNLHQYSWVVLFQTTAPQYQYLGALSGKETNQVVLYDNATHSPDSGGVDFLPLFNDPADNIVWQGAASSYGRVTGSGPYYLDWAIPITELTSRGINVSTTKFFATSTNANNYNKDSLQCYESFADLSVTKADSVDPVTSGGAETYTLSVHNAGPDTASGVVVTDTLPTGFAVTSVTPSQGSCSDTSVPSIQCELGSMTNGANATVTIAGTLTGSGTVTDTANVALDTTVSTDLNLANNSDSEDTVINPATGTLTFTKYTNPSSDPTKFDINVRRISDGVTTDTCNLGNGESCTKNLQPGTYQFYENLGDEWRYDIGGHGNFYCTKNGVDINYESSGNRFTIAAGEQIDCSVTNTKLAHLIIQKTTVPANDPQQFHVYATNTPGIPGTISFYSNSSGDINSSTSLNVYLVGGPVTVNESSVDDWEQTAQAGCQGITFAPGETKTCTFTNTKLPKLTVVKSLSPSLNPGKFNLLIDSGILANDIGDGGSTGTQTLTVGPHTVSETAGTGTTLSDYNSSYSTNCAGGNVTLSAGEDVTCTIYNTRKTGNVTIDKIVSGGTLSPSNWVFTVLGVAGSYHSGDVLSLDTGTYSISESGPDGYRLTDATGTCSAPDGSSATLTVTEAGTICHITNTRNLGTITVHKTLVGTNIGDGYVNFCFTLNPDPGIGQKCADDNGDAIFTNVPSGDYTASETQTLGAYTETATTCDQTMSIVNNGDSKSCGVTNTRNTGTIELRKVWSGIAGQTTLNIGTSAGGTQVTSVITGVNGAAPLTTGVNTVNTAAYYVSESGDLSNYTPVLDCTDNGQAFAPGVNDSFTVVKDHAYICTFTNTRNTGTITVHKVFEGDGPGTFENTCFTLNPDPGIGQICANSNGNTVFTNVPTGTYGADETKIQTDWHLKSNDCSELVLANNGDTARCTVTNAHNTGGLVVKKVVDDGSVLSQWSFSLDGAPAVAANAQGEVDFGQVITNDAHYIAESGPDTYHFVSFTGTNCNVNPNGGYYATVSNSGSTTCTFTNARNTGTLQVFKNVDLNGDGDYTDANETGATDWQWQAVGPTTKNGNTGDTVVTVPTGDYQLNETSKPGFHLDSSKGGVACTGGSVDGSLVTVAKDAVVVCTFYNVRDTGTIVLDKVTNPSGDETDFDLEAYTYTGIIGSGPTVGEGMVSDNDTPVSMVLPTGRYGVRENNPDTEYYLSDTTCVSNTRGALSNYYDFQLQSNETVTCTFSNVKYGHLIIQKTTNPAGDPTQFNVNASTENGQVIGDTTDGVISVDNPDNFEVKPGTYDISESLPNNWDQSGAICNNEDSPNNVTVSAGETVTCTFTNTKLDPKVTIEKSNDTNSNASAGGTVTYTLKVENTGNVNLNNLTVKDIMPGGFSYVLGSSTLNGGAVGNPSQSGNVLSWNIGSLSNEAVAIISYQVKLSSDLFNGSYTNYATCRALYGREQTIDCNTSSSTVSFGSGQSYGGGLQGQVLGASTELPATGSPTLLLIASLGLIGTGLFLNGFIGKTKKAKKVVKSDREAKRKSVKKKGVKRHAKK